MCCFSHLCLDLWQTWISCFQLCLWTLYLQIIIPLIRSMLSFSGHHLLTHSRCPVLRDTLTLCFCLSFWEWSLCSIYRESSSGFFFTSCSGFSPLGTHPFVFLDRRLEAEMACLMLTLRVVSSECSEDQGFQNKVFQKQTQAVNFQAYIYFHVFFSLTNISSPINSVINPNLVNSKHSSLSRK